MNRAGKLKIALCLAAIFAAGVVTGVFAAFQVARHFMPGPEKMAGRWCDDLRSKMNLTPDQVLKIRPIIDQTMTEFQGSMSSNMLTILSNCNARIATNLTQAELPEFTNIESEQQVMIHSMFGGGSSNPANKP